MLRLGDPGLEPAAEISLGSYQSLVNACQSYEEQVREAKRLFKARNTKTNTAFAAVRSTLAEMCTGTQRCGYCEDSAADEVEHVWPKDLYPEIAFAWSNYLYACGPCNGPKNKHFGVIATLPGGLPAVQDVSRPPKAPVIPPAVGDPAILDPRTDDPLDFMTLDLKDTYFFVPTGAAGSVGALRAQYTIDLLHLNDRDPLVRARRAAYCSFRALLKEYVSDKRAGASASELEAAAAALADQSHRTVWAEMRRQHAAINELAPLFAAAPEALTWLA